MTSHQSTSWSSSQGQYSDSYHQTRPNTHFSSQPPSAAPPHMSYYHHPPPPLPHPPHHSPPAHIQHPYHPYPSYAPYPFPYPHPSEHAPPVQFVHANNNTNDTEKQPSSSETVSDSLKDAETTKSSTKKPKTTKDSSSSESKKTSNAPKTPKTFRFEGSISSDSFKATKSFDMAGVNILNRKPLDTKAALDKLQRRRETHNRVERKRRDCINQLIDDLTQLLPSNHLEDVTSKCHRVNVLRGAVNHIKFLNESNEALTKSIRAIRGEDTDSPVPDQETNIIVKVEEPNDPQHEMSMDVDNEIIKEENLDGDSQFEDTNSQSSWSTSPSTTTSKGRPASSKKMMPPPVIVTNAPSTERDSTQKSPDHPNSFSLESRPRSNSFASSVGDHPSPRSTFSSSPTFPPSPISPLPFGRQSLFPPGEDNPERGSGLDKDQHLSPFIGSSPMTSPSLPPISSLANLHLQSPSGRSTESTSEDRSLSSAAYSTGPSFSARSHRAGTSLPPLMIPEPHHLHPSYQQGGSNSKRSSVTLSPNGVDQPLISPFMLSPMLTRSPSIGPTTASSPGNSPYPYWGQDGLGSPQVFPFTNHNQAQYGYQYSPQVQQQAPVSPKIANRPKSLQPEPIFIQEEPWNTPQKRSPSKQEKKKTEKIIEISSPTSPTSSVTSIMSYPASPNPKKRTQLESHDNDVEATEVDMAKRSKQRDEDAAIHALASLSENTTV
ncbi:hypothetical protein BGZ46_003191 [Entomortierella lignicola]|nr:hypothetical protein BGZ46_003191 [Entomortierella lignicola]